MTPVDVRAVGVDTATPLPPFGRRSGRLAAASAGLA